MTYLWKDVVLCNGEIHYEEFSISGRKDSEDVFDIDNYLYQVAKKYNCDPEDVKTYMMDNIDFDPNIIGVGAESLGCYIDGIPEWLLKGNHKNTALPKSKKMFYFTYQINPKDYDNLKSAAEAFVRNILDSYIENKQLIIGLSYRNLYICILDVLDFSEIPYFKKSFIEDILIKMMRYIEDDQYEFDSLKTTSDKYDYLCTKHNFCSYESDKEYDKELDPYMSDSNAIVYDVSLVDDFELRLIIEYLRSIIAETTYNIGMEKIKQLESEERTMKKFNAIIVENRSKYISITAKDINDALIIAKEKYGNEDLDKEWNIDYAQIKVEDPDSDEETEWEECRGF